MITRSHINNATYITHTVNTIISEAPPSRLHLHYYTTTDTIRMLTSSICGAITLQLNKLNKIYPIHNTLFLPSLPSSLCNTWTTLASHLTTATSRPSAHNINVANWYKILIYLLHINNFQISLLHMWFKYIFI